MERRYRQPASAQRPLVLVVDVSGSMAPYARMLLQYAQAAVAARRRVEAFAFGHAADAHHARARRPRPRPRAGARGRRASWTSAAGRGSAPRSASSTACTGGALGRGAVVVILSDGWDRGEPEELGAEMARLRRTAHRLVWLNPLAAARPTSR